jgi:predicted 3-demethylubiquinone-9 3-methyltransferase (glyoxalase superfamily)
LNQKITPFLWFDKEARAAAGLYTSVFADSRTSGTAELSGTPSGTVDIVEVELFGQGFTLMSAGPPFKFTPAVSFLVGYRTGDEVDAAWRELSRGGKPLMDLSAYPFSERYGWVEDRYGLSWQIMSMGGRELGQRITPTLMFVGRQCGKAEEAIRFYASVFNQAKVGDIMRYGTGPGPDRDGTVQHSAFTLEGQEFAAMDSALEHNFTFSEAISFVVHCANQAETDHYWNSLSADPEAERCGWLKDRYGLSWQVVPNALGEMLADRDAARVARVTEAFLKMKKLAIETLRRAYQGSS